MKKIIVLLLLAVSVSVFAGEPEMMTITVYNDTGYDFVELYISPTVSDEWGPDFFEDYDDIALYDGETIEVNVPGIDGEPLFDVQAVDDEGDLYQQFEVELFDGGEIYLTFDDYVSSEDSEDVSYDDGSYDEGYNAGYTEGYRQGFVDAFKEAFMEGFNQAKEIME